MKKHKKLIITLLILILLPIGIFTIDFGVQSCMVMNYLCQKYYAEITDFKLVKYTPNKIKYLTPESSVLLDFENTSPLWEFEYNGVLFNVQKLNPIGYKYFDDYQLEEVNRWSVEYLKENVDENIIGTYTSTSKFYKIAQNDEYYRTHRFTQDKILDYINQYECFPIYYYSDYEEYRYNGNSKKYNAKLFEIRESLVNSSGIQFRILELRNHEETYERMHKCSDIREYTYTYVIDKINEPDLYPY